jgi:hypothetical protein
MVAFVLHLNTVELDAQLCRVLRPVRQKRVPVRREDGGGPRRGQNLLVAALRDDLAAQRNIDVVPVDVTRIDAGGGPETDVADGHVLEADG